MAHPFLFRNNFFESIEKIQKLLLTVQAERGTGSYNRGLFAAFMKSGELARPGNFPWQPLGGMI